jgi:hypothetical protein
MLTELVWKIDFKDVEEVLVFLLIYSSVGIFRWTDD